MKIRIFLMLVLLISVSCKKNRNHPVPSIPFDIEINISLPSYSELQGVGGWTTVNGGSKGIIIYRKSYDEFVGFDLHSPANNGTCEQPLVPDANNFLQLNDLCSQASFSLYDGSPMSGSDLGLRQYQVSWNGSYNIRIRN